MKQPNRIKAAMRAGRKAYGYGLTFPSPWVIDILGKLDFDYVFIDGEHGPFDLERLEELCRTAERYHLTYMRASRVKRFLRDRHSFLFLRLKRAREHSSALMAQQLLAWPR